ncbi:MAG TPA: hypothetical protein V6D11_03510 [Waterburya sp.]
MNNDFSSAAMSFFNPNVPLLCPKQNVQELPDSPGLWRCCWQVGDITLVSTFYTPLDQVCLVWGVISLVIFTTAQFLPISWLDQAVWWSILTLIGTVGMVVLTPSWLKGAELGWVVYSWVFLMLLGVVITDLAIFLSWGDVLTSLCQLWLGLVGLGYLFTGLGMRSRTLILTSLVHLLGIAALPYMSTMQFLVTGVIMGGSSLLLAVFQWDSFGACGGQIESHQLNGVV